MALRIAIEGPPLEQLDLMEAYYDIKSSLKLV